MKKIGMLGGMSWESSMEYYRLMNKMVKEKLGGSHSVNCLMYSFDFQEVEDLQHEGKWEELTNIMIDEAINLKSAGTECIVICTNTMHKMAPDIIRETKLPLIHIAEVTGVEIKKNEMDTVLLLGTKFTMGGTFYSEKLAEKGIKTIVPNDEEQQIVHDVIYHELILGEIKESSREAYKKIIDKYGKEGAQGVILGCTEIPSLIKQKDVDIKVYDTTYIHAKAAVEFALDL